MKLLQRSIKNQNGSVLIVSLVILLLLMILGLTAMQSTTLEEKMSGNISERNTAFQAAEAALRDAETEINAPTRFISKYPGPTTDPNDLRRVIGETGFSTACINGLCLNSNTATRQALLTSTAVDAGGNPFYTTYSSVTGPTTAATTTLGLGSPIPLVSTQPRYVIDFSCRLVNGTSNCQYTYTITAIGFGARFSSQAVLESIYRAN